jgi:hypothetical protein
MLKMLILQYDEKQNFLAYKKFKILSTIYTKLSHSHHTSQLS